MSEKPALKECALSGTRLDRRLVVDVHGHLGGTGGFDIPAREPEQVISIMDRIGIDVLCISHLTCLRGDYRRGNELTADAMRRFPGRFIGYAVPNPNFPDDIERELDRCTGELGMKGIKTHSGFHDYPSDGPAYRKVYEYAQVNGGLPVLGHSFGDAAATERIARAFPDVPFIAAHLGGLVHAGRFSDEMVRVVNELGNVYIDIASSLAFFGTIEALVERIGPEKILFGSDVCYQQATHQIGSVLFADIAERDKEMILGLNAAKLFKLEASNGNR